MMTVLILILFIAVLWALAYHGAPLWGWTAFLAGALVAFAYTGVLGATGLVLGAVLLGGFAVAFHTPGLRRRFFSGPLFALVRRVLPSMSDTEREALEAGSVWWEQELFAGAPRWSRLLALPSPTLNEEERAFLEGPTEELCAMIDQWKISEELQDMPPEVWAFIKEQGFFAMIIPKEYGGLEFSAYMHSQVVMKISSRSGAVAVTVMVPNSLGPAELLLHYGTEEQRRHYLPRLARGEEIPCFALTGPEAGSDAGAMPDTGVVCRGTFEGKDIIGLRLNWNKRYITLAPVATVLGLAFKLYDPDGLLGGEPERGITCALIRTDTPGVDIGERHDPLGVPFLNGPTTGKDVFIPLEWIIGGQAEIGNGWRMLVERLAVGRGISLPALATGAGKLVSRATGAYARIRRQFRLPIGRFEGVEEALTKIAGFTYLMDAARTLTTTGIDQGADPSVVTAIVKYQLTERMREVINAAMDVQGGSAIMLGPRNIIASAYQSIPISITVEGANILTRGLIIYGQGAVRCHPYVHREMEAVAEPDRARGLADFDEALMGHIGYFARNEARALFLGISGGWLSHSPGGPLAHIYRRLNRWSAAFAFLSDSAMVALGGSLKRREKISGRFADAFANLYLASAVLKRFEDQGRNEQDLPLARWACEYCLYEITMALDGILRNFPNRWLAGALRAVVFPLGRRQRPPTDKLGHQVTQVILNASPARDRLTAGIYLPTSPGEVLQRLDDALVKVIAAEPVEKKLKSAARDGALQPAPPMELAAQAREQDVIDAHAYELLQQAHAARTDVIQVDAFAAHHFGRDQAARAQPEKKTAQA